MKDVFISYSKTDKIIADKVCSMLESNNINCWIAPRDINVGMPFEEAILEGIDMVQGFLLIYSENSNNSIHVLREVRYANDTNKNLLIFRLDNEDYNKNLRYYLQGIQWVEGYENLKESVLKILRPGEVVQRHFKSPQINPKINLYNRFLKNKYAFWSILSLGLLIIIVGIAFILNFTDVSNLKFFDKILLSEKSDGTVNQLDSNSVRIGSQVWMKSNLNVDHFRNGDSIPEVKSITELEECEKNKQPAWRYIKKDDETLLFYGKLYNWYAVNDPRGLAPVGWHIPSDEEWTTLTYFLGGKDIAGVKLKSTGTNYWKSPNVLATNESDFSGLPGGGIAFFKDSDWLAEFPVGHIGCWWSSSESNSYSAEIRMIYSDSGSVTRINFLKNSAFSVRCIKD